jgi:hypothetical protein
MFFTSPCFFTKHKPVGERDARPIFRVVKSREKRGARWGADLLLRKDPLGEDCVSGYLNFAQCTTSVTGPQAKKPFDPTAEGLFV